MGFFDKMKAMNNAVTGGTARVSIESEEFSFDAPFTVTVIARTGSAPVKINRVYLQVQGEEEVAVELPSDAPAVYRGHYCQHTYNAFAGLDCFGNDPDSGWVELSD